MPTKMTREAASRIQSAACKAGGGVVQTETFAARAMSAAYRNEPLSQPISSSTGISKTLVKLGLFAIAGVATYYYGSSVIKTFSPFQ